MRVLIVRRGLVVVNELVEHLLYLECDAVKVWAVEKSLYEEHSRHGRVSEAIANLIILSLTD